MIGAGRGSHTRYTFSWRRIPRRGGQLNEVTKECRLCGSTGPHQTIAARKMYFGTREPFEYYSCAAYDTLQIVNVLEGEELMRHYPANYYSYNVSAQPRVLR